MIAGIHGNKTLHIVQRMDVWLRATLQPEGELIAGVKHFTDLRLAHGRVDVGQLVIDRLHQPANRLIDPGPNFLAVDADNIAVHIDRRFLQRFGQVKFSICIALPHFNALCLFDGLILGQLGRGVFPQETLDFQIGLDLRQELCVVG